jgi:hypothetical protein
VVTREVVNSAGPNSIGSNSIPWFRFLWHPQRKKHPSVCSRGYLDHKPSRRLSENAQRYVLFRLFLRDAGAGVGAVLLQRNSNLYLVEQFTFFEFVRGRNEEIRDLSFS